MGLYLSFPDGELYTATVSDFSGSDPLIYKEPLRTVQFDSKHLNGKLYYYYSKSLKKTDFLFQQKLVWFK